MLRAPKVDRERTSFKILLYNYFPIWSTHTYQTAKFYRDRSSSTAGTEETVERRSKSMTHMHIVSGNPTTPKPHVTQYHILGLYSIPHKPFSNLFFVLNSLADVDYQGSIRDEMGTSCVANSNVRNTI